MPEQPIIDLSPESRAAMLRLVYDACAMLMHPERQKVFDRPGSRTEEHARRLVRIGIGLGLVTQSELDAAAGTLAQRLTVARRDDGTWAFATPEEAAEIQPLHSK